LSNYTVYPGKWPCHTCKEVVLTLRCYAETKTLTWMCKEKHLTTVYLGRRKKKDFDGKE